MEKQEIKEDFCGACLAIPIALAGVGTSAVSTKGSYKKNKNIILLSGIGLIILSIIIYYYFNRSCTNNICFK